jgi:integrase
MSIHHTKTGKWEVRYREGRRNRSKTFDLKEDARSFEAEARVRRQRGEHVRRSSDTPTLRDFTADWMDRRRAAGLSEMTLKTNGLIFGKHLDPYLGGLRIGDLSPRRLDEWRRELEAAGATTYMINRSKTLLGQILADARRLDFVAVNLARGPPTVRRRARRGRTATPEQVEAMRASFIEGGHLGHATLISLLAYVGLRPREALDLRWEMVDRERLILPAELTKGRMARVPDIPDAGRRGPGALAAGLRRSGRIGLPAPERRSQVDQIRLGQLAKARLRDGGRGSRLARVGFRFQSQGWRLPALRPTAYLRVTDDPRPRRSGRRGGATRHQPRARLPDLRPQHRGDARAALGLDRQGDLGSSRRAGLR